MKIIQIKNQRYISSVNGFKRLFKKMEVCEALFEILLMIYKTWIFAKPLGEMCEKSQVTGKTFSYNNLCTNINFISIIS